MEAEHAGIDPLIETIDAAPADPEAGPERVAAATDALTVSLLAHLKHEETEGLPLIDATLSQEQFVHFGQVHAVKTGPDGPRLTPWLLAGADEKATATMPAILPPPVLAAYRNEWQPAYEALVRASLALLALPEASEQWARWWERELTRPEGQGRGFCAPAAKYGDGQELDALVRACFEDAARWSSDRGREDAEVAAEAQAREDPGPEGDLVRMVEEEIGRKARPFELEVTVMPVAGTAGWRVSRTHVVVSRALRADAAAYCEWLTPVVRELA